MTDEKIEELRAATRAANEALKEIKLTLKEIKKVRDDIENRIKIAFDEMIADVVKESLARYQESLDKAVEDGTNAVFKRFDDLAAIALGETKDQIRRGERTIPEIIEDIGARKQAPPIQTRKNTW